MCRKLRDGGKKKSSFCKIAGRWGNSSDGKQGLMSCSPHPWCLGNCYQGWVNFQPNFTMIPAPWKWGHTCKEAVSPESYRTWLAWTFPRRLTPPGKGLLQDAAGVSVVGQGWEGLVSIFWWTRAIPSSAFSCLCTLKDGDSNTSIVLFQASQGFPCPSSPDTEGDDLLIFLL